MFDKGAFFAKFDADAVAEQKRLSDAITKAENAKEEHQRITRLARQQMQHACFDGAKGCNHTMPYNLRGDDKTCPGCGAVWVRVSAYEKRYRLEWRGQSLGEYIDDWD